MKVDSQSMNGIKARIFYPKKIILPNVEFREILHLLNKNVLLLYKNFKGQKIQ
jgi:hypothetical protein